MMHGRGAFVGVIDATTGLIAIFISKPDLIASKLAGISRTRDLADVEEIAEAGESDHSGLG